MATKEVIRLQRDAELVSKALRAVPAAIKSDVLMKACMKAAVPIYRATKASAPVKTGALRNSIIIKGHKKESKAFGMALIGVDTSYFKQGKRTAKSKIDFSKDKVDRPVWYAHLVEYGFTNRHGKWVPPHPFVRPGAIAGAAQAEAILQLEINNEIERALARVILTGG